MQNRTGYNDIGEICKIHILFLIGKTSCGKGTNGRRLKEVLEQSGIKGHFFSVGDELKKLSSGEGTTRSEVAKRMRAGKQVDNKLVVENVFKPHLGIGISSGANVIIVDGGLRGSDQSEMMFEHIRRMPRSTDNFNIVVIEIDQTDEICAGRALAGNSDRSDRLDNNPESVRRRLTEYVDLRKGAMTVIRKEGVLLKVFKPENMSPDEVFEEFFDITIGLCPELRKHVSVAIK